MKVTILNGEIQTMIMMKDILYCLGIGPTLVSISALAKDSYTIVFQGMACHVYNLKKELIG